MVASIYQGFAVDETGDIIASATVTVRDQDTNAISTIWSNRATTSSKSNPLTADSNGYFFFYAAGGRYKIQVSDGVTTTEYADVQIGLASEYDVGSSSGQIPTVDDIGTAAISNSYNDLDNLPALGTMAALNSGTGSGDFRTNTLNDARFLRLANNLNDVSSVSGVIANLGLATTIQSITDDQVTWLGNAETAVTWTGNDASFAGNISSPVISGTAIVANGTDVTTEVVELAGITTNYTPKKTATGYADSALSWSGNDASIAGVVGVGGSSNASYGVLSNSLPIAVIRTANDTTDTNVLVTGRGTAAGNTGSIYSTGGGANNVTNVGVKIGSTEIIDCAVGTVSVTGAINLTGNLNNKPTHRQTPNLFVKPTTEDTLGYVGAMELSSVVCVADVSGSLNNKYFRLYGAAGTSAALDTTAAAQIIDVWFDVSSGGSVPSTGAGRMIEVDIATDDTAATVAAAIATALNADAAFSAGVDDDTVYIAHITPTDFTAASAGDSGFTVATESSGSGSLSGSSKWLGGVLAPNGCIYGIPINSTVVLKIDPATDTATTFGSLSGTDKWYGGVLAGNGCIYGIPLESTTVLKIDPTTDTATTFGSLSGSSKWIGGVLAGNGCIYGIPYNSATVLKIDPTTDTATTFGSLSGTGKWYGGVLAPNGCIYGIPYTSTTVLKIDPTTDTATTFGSLSGSYKWAGGVLAPNGCIYGIPYSSTTALKIDPTTDTATTFGSLSGSYKWAGGVLAPNGCIYGIPYNSTTALKIDPTTDTATTFGSLSGSNKWSGGVLAPNGCIYGIPTKSTTALKIDGGLYDVPDYMLSAYVNKF